MHVMGALSCCSVLQCVAVCCSALQCVAVCCSALRCVAVCGSVLQCVAVCCSALQCVAVCCSALRCVAVCCSVLQFVARDGRFSLYSSSCTNQRIIAPAVRFLRRSNSVSVQGHVWRARSALQQQRVGTRACPACALLVMVACHLLSFISAVFL